MVYFFVGLGGVAGSLLRYCLSQSAVYFFGRNFPVGTLFINLTGAFLLGWITTKWGTAKKLHPHLLTALTTGVIGSYTTFSTFCYDTVHLIQMKEYFYGSLYLLASLFGGLFFVNVGMKLGMVRGKALGDQHE